MVARAMSMHALSGRAYGPTSIRLRITNRSHERRSTAEAGAGRGRRPAVTNADRCRRRVLGPLRPAFPVLGRPPLIPESGLQRRALFVYRLHVQPGFRVVGVQMRSAQSRIPRHSAHACPPC